MVFYILGGAGFLPSTVLHDGRSVKIFKCAYKFWSFLNLLNVFQTISHKWHIALCDVKTIKFTFSDSLKKPIFIWHIFFGTGIYNFFRSRTASPASPQQPKARYRFFWQPRNLFSRFPTRSKLQRYGRCQRQGIVVLRRVCWEQAFFWANFWDLVEREYV